MPVVQQTLSDPPGSSSKQSVDQSYRERYEAYINSSRWERRRVAYFSRHPKVCRACGSKTQIHLHHHTYKRMGNEMDEDLVPLCQGCHDLCHKLHRANPGMSLTRATGEFLKINGAVLRPKSKGSSPRRKKAAPAKVPVGHVTRAEAEKRLVLAPGRLPEGKPKRSKKNGGHVSVNVINQWLADPPPWLLQARQYQDPQPPKLRHLVYSGGGRPYSPEVAKLLGHSS